MVDVSSQSNKVNITVSSSGVSSNVNASGDTSHYYSEKAREWAISNRIVDGVDYSSKYYAGRANQSALNAQSFAQSAQDSYNNFQQSIDGALSNIDSSVQGGIDEINNTKTTILNDIEFVAEGEKEEIQELADQAKDDIKSTGFYMRDDKLYFINSVGEEEEFKTNDNELNNPFSLLDYKFSEYELSNISWLRSNGQYNSKAIYPAVYDLLLKIYNGTETKAGVSVKLNTETFTDYDFVLNTAEETFRLPVKVKLASGKAVVGDGNPLGLLVGTEEDYLYNNYHDGISRLEARTINGVASGILQFASVNPDPTKSGIETSNSGLYLYFYVGETVQNANLINAGRIEEKIASLITIVETYQNGTSWYRLWSDNWCEQGGIITVSTNVYKGQEVTLLKAYKDTNYHINAKNSIVTNDAGVQSLSVNAIAANANPLTNSTFAVALYAACKSCRWTTSGYIA